MDDKYEYKTYDMARFYVEEGMYSIKEIEQLLALLKDARDKQREALARSMEPIEAALKERNT
jgi:hypothetical protein